MPQFKGEKHLSELLLADLDQGIVDSFHQDDTRLTIRGREVPIIYATQERYAQMQMNKGVRDDNGVLILPLVSVRRTGMKLIDEYYRESAGGKADGITLIKRPATERNTPIRLRYGNAFMAQKIHMPLVYETVRTDYPIWYKINYEIILWSSYVGDMNGMQEQLLENYRGFYTSGPYKFYGYIDGSVEDISNLADFTANERIIKSRYSIALEAYFHKQAEVTTRRTMSNFAFTTEITKDLSEID
jgi:hypothetical protein